MNVKDWIMLGGIYGAILFGTLVGMLSEYSWGSFLLLSAFLMEIWLVMSLLIERRKD